MKIMFRYNFAQKGKGNGRAFNTGRLVFSWLDSTHFKGNFENISMSEIFYRACRENEIQVPSAVDRPGVLRLICVAEK